MSSNMDLVPPADSPERGGSWSRAVRRAGVLFGLAAVVTAGLFVVGASPSPAGCPSWGDPYTAWTPTGQIYGTEWARYPSTCDGDGIYKGKVVDELTDGSCVYIQYRESSGDSWRTQAYDCSESGSSYTYWDQNGDHQSQMRLGRKVGGSYQWEYWVWNSGY
ncbi:MAG TPA: hypothetical protein ENK55_05115 [Actinobacteria bacterium]|nr:hypothetical protein [Actinomycetota bacterium]